MFRSARELNNAGVSAQPRINASVIARFLQPAGTSLEITSSRNSNDQSRFALTSVLRRQHRIVGIECSQSNPDGLLPSAPYLPLDGISHAPSRSLTNALPFLKNRSRLDPSNDLQFLKGQTKLGPSNDQLRRPFQTGANKFVPSVLLR